MYIAESVRTNRDGLMNRPTRCGWTDAFGLRLRMMGQSAGLPYYHILRKVKKMHGAHPFAWFD